MKIIKQDEVMSLIVNFSGQTFSNSKEVYSWLDKAIRKLLENENQVLKEKLGRRLKYCQEQNGLPYCKNCGLSSDDLKLLD